MRRNPLAKTAAESERATGGFLSAKATTFLSLPKWPGLARSTAGFALQVERTGFRLPSSSTPVDSQVRSVFQILFVCPGPVRAAEPPSPSGRRGATGYSYFHIFACHIDRSV